MHAIHRKEGNLRRNLSLLVNYNVRINNLDLGLKNINT